MKIKKISLIPYVAALGMFALVAGCEYRSVIVTEPGRVAAVGHMGGVAPTTPTQPSETADTGTGAIILNSLDANPTNVATKIDKITFTVNAFNSNRAPMEYSWSSTKGTLSGTRGQTVFWTPQKTDGSLETGVATVQVLITDPNGATKQAAVNILINQDGSASKQ